jgi:hypothetical protein
MTCASGEPDTCWFAWIATGDGDGAGRVMMFVDPPLHAPKAAADDTAHANARKRFKEAPQFGVVPRSVDAGGYGRRIAGLSLG